MKFADGFWLNRHGYEVNYVQQAYEVRAVKNGINVLAATQYIHNRGMTLGGPVLDMTFSSSQKDVIKVTIDHYKGTNDNIPKFELNEDQGYSPEIANAFWRQSLRAYLGTEDEKTVTAMAAHLGRYKGSHCQRPLERLLLLQG